MTPNLLAITAFGSFPAAAKHDPGPQHIALLGSRPGDPSLQHLPLAAGQSDRHRSR